MTAGRTGARDGGEIEALITDMYLDSLLAGIRDQEIGALGPLTDRLEPSVRLAAARLGRDLVRFHPSFQFEERLARRLADHAATLGIPIAADGATLIALDTRRTIPLSGGTGRQSAVDGQPLAPLDERLDRVRPLLIGGALTSAALSLAGAAFMAWRRTRPGTPMARAVRAVARGRLA